MKKIEFHLDFCDICFQMTNHVGDECQKCKAKENKINRYDDDEFYDDKVKNIKILKMRGDD